MSNKERETLEVVSDAEPRSESGDDDDLDSPTGFVAMSGPEVRRSSIQRSRAVVVNKPPAKRRRHQVVRGENNPKNVSVHERISSFPKDYFEMRSKRLFCGACMEFVSTKMATIKSHVKTTKHVNGKAKRAESKLKEIDIAKALQRQDKAIHQVGETLPEQQRVFRIEVVEGFLKGGVPLAKIDRLRPLLEKGGYRLTGSANLAQLIPIVHGMEMKRLREELACAQGGNADDVQVAQPSSGRLLSIIFDGSTRLGEAIAIIVRFVDDSWKIRQRLIRFDVVEKSVNAQDLSHVLMECIFQLYQVRGTQVMAVMRDGAAVNGAAIDHLRVFMPRMIDIVCFSHTMDNVGKRFDTPVLDTFGQHWVRLFSTSCRAKLQWKQQTGQAPKSFSETRWWSRWEVYNQLFNYFGDVRQFLENNEDLAPKTMDHLRGVLEDEQQVCRLKLELAATIDIGKHFVTATYDLEGDGALALSCYERLQAVANACRPDAMHLPNVHAVATDLAATFPQVTIDWAEGYGRESIRPAVMWFHRKFNVQLYATVRAFKAARLLCPVTVCSLNPTPQTIEQLRAFPFLDNDQTIQQLAEELPAYLAAAEDVTFAGSTIAEVSERKVEWWRDHSHHLPHWATALQKVLLVQPSSAAAERAFSLLASAFGEQQKSALADYLECSLMLRYNNR